MGRMMKLEKHEAFWSEKFNETNLQQFKNWVQQSIASREWLSKFLKREKIQDILDVGCGIALDYEQFLKDNLLIDYHGIDVTRVFLEQIKTKFPNLDVRLASAENIPYPNETFEAVSCRHLLEHLRNPERAISEMQRVSKKFVLFTWFVPPVEAEENKIELVRFDSNGKIFYQNTYCRKYLDAVIKKNNLFLRQKQKAGTDEIWALRK